MELRSAIVFVELRTDDIDDLPCDGKRKFKPPVRDRPIVGDGLGLLATDPATLPFRGHFEYRWKVYTDLRKSIQETAGSLTQFASGYEKLGFTKDEENLLGQCSPESLVGDFNQWNEGATPMRKFGSTYDGIYWDPANASDTADLCFKGFTAPRPDMPQSLRIYEAHEFARDVLPRIKETGYNCIQLMAVMEHSYYGSFGYHVTSPFAVSSRSGTPDEFKALVDEAHRLGLLDLVHSHVSNNADDGLNGMDFGQAEPKPRFNPPIKGWGTWQDVDAVVYLMLASELVKSLRPNAIMIAEDVSGMPGLCMPVAEGPAESLWAAEFSISCEPQ
eukprot:Skav207812  [mRNA]  locus=scaffold381:408122:425879:+ [translate_table: standard]